MSELELSIGQFVDELQQTAATTPIHTTKLYERWTSHVSSNDIPTKKKCCFFFFKPTNISALRIKITFISLLFYNYIYIRIYYTHYTYIRSHHTSCFVCSSRCHMCCLRLIILSASHMRCRILQGT